MVNRIKSVLSTVVKYGLIVAVAVAFAFSIKTIWANWTAPLATPPTCTAGNPGCDPPINVSSVYQTKGGSVPATSLLQLYNTADNILTFQRSGAANPTNFRLGTDSAFVINNSGVDTLTLRGGNVGIGTTGPGAKLDVGGGGVLLNGTAGRNYFKDSEKSDGVGLRVGALWGMYGVYAETGIGQLGGAGGTGLQNNSLFVNTSGNVGIGTVTPGRRLHVFEDTVAAGTYQLRLEGNAGGYYDLGRDNASGMFHFFGSQSGFNGYIFDGANGERMRIASSGNVGIGTTSPGAMLQVGANSGVSNGEIILAKSNSGPNRAFRIGLDSNYYFSIGDYVNGGGPYAPYLTIPYGGGNVGIGNTDPGQRLDIAGAMRLRPSSAPPVARGVMYTDSTGVFKCSNAAGTAFEDCGGAGGAGFWTQSGTNLYPNDLSWNVGVGTETPTATFDVSGNFAVTTGTSTSQPLQEAGVGYTGCVKPQEINGGYMFTANVAGTITKLWGKFGLASEPARTTTVRLYQCTDGSCTSGSEVASVVLNLQGSWASQSITPFSAAAGTSYVVAAYGAGEYCTDDSFNTNPDISNGLVTIKESRIYIGLPDFPALKFESPMYGLADITFVRSGPIKTNFTVASSGNVGIGTTSPPSRLTVSSSGTGIAQLGVQGCGGDYVSLTLGQTVVPSGCSNYNILSSPTDQNLYFNVPDLPDPAQANFYFREANSTRVVILGGGYALDGTYLTLGQRDVTTSGPNNETLYLNYSNESGDVQIGGEGENKTLYVKGDVSVANQLGVYGGRIYINNNDPSGPGDRSGLHMWNTLALYSNCCGYTSADNYGILFDPRNGGADFKGTVFASAFAYRSDISLKTEIKPLNNTLSKVMDLQGMSYIWKDGGSPQIGFVAQDVEKIFPELVFENSENGLKSLDYGRLTAPLTEAIKELKEEKDREIQELREEIQELENRLQDLESVQNNDPTLWQNHAPLCYY